jgi:hypothetical protein
MPKQNIRQETGAWEVRRRFKIPALTQAEDSSELDRSLCRIPGLHQAQIDPRRQRLEVWYDVRRVSYQQILTVLTNAGFPPRNGWWFRRKQSWYRFTEANDRENAKAPPAACCNKPPK